MLIHSFDGREEPSKPWLPCTGEAHYCYALVHGLLDRMATSVVFANDGKAPQYWNQRIYNPQEGGIVLNPDVNTILCSYSQDSGSDMRRCEKNPHCVPGCSAKGTDRPGEWCSPSYDHGACAWPPHLLKDMMQRTLPGYQTNGGHYNEIVVDAHRFQEQLPMSLEAFWFDAKHSKDGGRTQREQHAAFLRDFNLRENDVPLLKLEYSSDRQRLFSPA